MLVLFCVIILVLPIRFAIQAIQQARLTPEQKTATVVAAQAAGTAQAIQQATVAAASYRATATTQAIQVASATAQAIQVATATTQAIQNATTTMQAAQAKLEAFKQQGKLIGNDDFVDNRHKWDIDLSDVNVNRTIREGQLVMIIRTENYIGWDLWIGKQHNFITEIDIDPRSFKSFGGIVFGYEDQNNFYSAQISGDGSYRLQRLRGGEWTNLLDWKAHAVISKDLAANRLTLIRQDNTISIYVNNVLVEEVQADALPDGQVGLLAGAFSVDSAEVHFDNFRLWRLP